MTIMTIINGVILITSIVILATLICFQVVDLIKSYGIKIKLNEAQRAIDKLKIVILWLLAGIFPVVPVYWKLYTIPEVSKCQGRVEWIMFLVTGFLIKLCGVILSAEFGIICYIRYAYSVPIFALPESSLIVCVLIFLGMEWGAYYLINAIVKVFVSSSTINGNNKDSKIVLSLSMFSLILMFIGWWQYSPIFQKEETRLNIAWGREHMLLVEKIVLVSIILSLLILSKLLLELMYRICTNKIVFKKKDKEKSGLLIIDVILIQLMLFSAIMIWVYGFMEQGLQLNGCELCKTPNYSIGSLIYYVIMTYTTVGYGDIIPTSWYMQLFACCISLSGFLTSVVLISKLIEVFAETNEN